MGKMARKLRHSVMKRLRRLAQHTSLALSPRVIDLEVTRACNLRCPMCSRQQTPPGNRELTVEQFRHIADQLPALKAINILGWGEPFLSSHLFGILDVAASRGIRATLTTNGTLLGPQQIGDLPENVTQVFVSIDSPVPRTYEQLRPGATLETVTRNVQRLKGARPQVRLVIQGVLTKATVQDAADLVRLAGTTGADEVSLLHLVPFREEDGRAHLVGEESAQRPIQAAREAADDLGIALRVPDLNPRARACRMPWREPHIAADGMVRPCSFMQRGFGPLPEWFAGHPLIAPERQYRMGNVLKQPFRAIWNGPAFRRVRRAILKWEREESVSIEQLRTRRQEADLGEEFSYCRVCLWRWGCSC